MIEVVNNSVPARAPTHSITASDGVGFISSDTTLVSTMIMPTDLVTAQVWTARKLQLNSADLGEAIQYGGEKSIRVTGPTDCLGENGADLRFHRSAMDGRTDAQSLLHLSVQIPDRHSCHSLDLQVAINDSTR